jgi:hypothetical protein
VLGISLDQQVVERLQPPAGCRALPAGFWSAFPSAGRNMPGHKAPADPV